METLTAEQFQKKYGQAGVSAFASPVAKPSYASRIKESVSSDIATRTEKFGDIQSRNTNPLEKGVQEFGQGAGMAAHALETAVTEIPGVKQGMKGIGAGINWLATSELSPIKHLGDLIGKSKTLQTAVNLYDTDNNFKDTIDAVANIVRLGGDVQTAVDSANFTANVTNKIIKSAKTITPSAKGIVDAAGNILPDTSNASAGIMNRVARLKPSDAKQFESMAGKTVGQYLVDNGNFGAPDEILKNEAIKFTNSLNEVDSAFDKLPGLYKPGAVGDALKEVIKKGESVSTPSVKSPYLSKAEDLLSRYEQEGLSMKDINDTKRLFERNVKLGYNKLLNADKIEQATNIDSAIRNWQVKQAENLGFTNVSELNKQTQLSKFILNKLGEQIIGQKGLNAVNLTDWIVLAGGDPSSVAAFLVKKFFSSKSVQAKIAELLNKEKIKSPVKADLSPTIENSLRRAFPKGRTLELPAPSSSVKSSNYVPLRQKPPYSAEKPTFRNTKPK